MGTWFSLFYVQPVKDEDKTGSNLYSVYNDVYIDFVKTDIVTSSLESLEIQQFLCLDLCKNMCISWESTINFKNVITLESDSCRKL